MTDGNARGPAALVPASSSFPNPEIIPFNDLLDTINWPTSPGPPATWPPALQAALTILKSTTAPLLLLIGSQNLALFYPAYAHVLGLSPDAFGKATVPPPQESLVPVHDSTGAVVGALWFPPPPPPPPSPPHLSGRRDEMLKKMASRGTKEGRHGVKACVEAMVGVLKEYGVEGIEMYKDGNEEIGDRVVAVEAGEEANEVMREAILTARALELSHGKVEALEKSQHEKMTFYANCSHEFRTPLELILGPVEDILAEARKGHWSVSDEVMERLEIVKKSGGQLLKLVNHMLLFSTVNRDGGCIHPRPADLACETREVAALFKTIAKRFGLAFDVECTPEAEKARVYFGEDMYPHILLNLLSNAFKSTLKGGVRVRLSIEEMDNVEQPVIAQYGRIVRVDPPRRREFVTLRVSDTGVGIPTEHLGRIFDRFYTIPNSLVARSVEGIGIGLHIVSELVKGYGGNISAESEEGKGSTFTVRIPLGTDHLNDNASIDDDFPVLPHDADGAIHNQGPANPERVAPAPSITDMVIDEMLGWTPHRVDLAIPSASAATTSSQAAEDATSPLTEQGIFGSRTLSFSPPLHPASKSSPSSLLLDAERQSTVLLVEDNADLLRFLAQLLTKENFNVLTASNGEEAMRIATGSKDVDMVLTDKIMPVMGGLELIRGLRMNPKTQLIPIVLLTVRTGMDETVDGFEAGADDYLTKPFMIRELVARVTVHCNLQRMRIKTLKAFQGYQVLEAANEAKAKFLSLVSHEMRTPLFSITGNVELLQISTLNAEQRAHLVTIGQSSQVLLALIQDVLDIGKLEATDNFSFEVDNFNPRELVRTVAGHLGGGISPTTINIRTYIDAGVPECICADLKRVHQVISKLISNAIKFSEKPGAVVDLKVSMRADAMPKSVTDEEGEAKHSPALYVECTDNGIGMHSTEHIFKPFWQADIGATRQYGGSGLGLTVARQLVKKAGGDMGVESKPSVGSKLWFTWPVVIPPPDEHDRHHHTDVNIVLGIHQDQGQKNKKRTQFLSRLRSDSNVHKSPGEFLLQYLPMRRSPGGRSPKSPPESPRTSYFQETSSGRNAASKRGSTTPVGSPHKTSSGTTSPAVSPSATAEVIQRESHPEAVMASPPPLPSPLPAKAKLQQIRVLLAEDNLVNRQLMVRQLQTIGLRLIDTANNGLEVLKLINDKVALGENGVTGREGYHLILMDVDMPFVSGHDATIKIRRIDHPLKDIPIIAVTANAYASDRQKCLDVGMSDFAPKPVSLDELKNVIARWI